MSSTPPSRRRWQDMSPAQRAVIVTVGSIEVILTATALVDLARRPAGQVRGPKLMWLAGCIVQPVGPMAYLAWGRRPATG